MDFQQLTVFLSVAAQRSFTRAAESLFISQPAVSVRIKGLEEELGVILFERSRPRELSLTEAGRKFLDYAQKLVNLKEEAQRQMASEEGAAIGLVRLGASSVPGIYLLPFKLAEFKKRQPGIALSLSIMDSFQVLAKLFSYDLDLGFVGSLAQDERLQYYPIADDELVLITPPGHFDAALADVQSDGAAALPLEICLSGNLILRESGSATRALFEAALAHTQVSLRDFAALTFIDNLEAIKQSVRGGLGISLVSQRSAADFLQLKLVDGYRLAGLDLTRQIYMVRHTGRVLSRAARLTMDLFSTEPGSKATN